MTVITSSPLSADTIKMRWKEPYVTAALNQKNIASTPKGVLTGFTVIPSATPLHITLQVDPTLGISAANVLETTGGVYRVSIVQTSSFDVNLTPAAGQTVYVCLDAQYSVGTSSAAQVKVVDDAELVANPDLVMLAKVTVPGAGVIPSGNINLGYRVAAGDSETPEMHQHFNLVYNPTFEATNAGWANNGFDSATASTDFARTGGYSLKLVKAVAAVVDVVAGPMPVVPARNYRVSIWFHSPGGLTGPGAQFEVGFYDAAGAQIGGWTPVEAAVTTATASWVLRKSEVVAPALALTAKVRILFNNSSGTLYADDVEFSSHMHDEVVKSAVFGGPTVPADAYHTHTALGLNYAGGVNWADGTTNPATTIEGQLDKILTDLAGAGGAPKIGNCPSKITLNTFTQLNTFNNGIALGASQSAAWATGWRLRDSSNQQFFIENDVFFSGLGVQPYRFFVELAGDAAHLEFYDSVRAGIIGLNSGGAAYTAWSGLGVGTTSNDPISLVTNSTTVWQVAQTGQLQAVGGNRAIQNVLDPVTAQDAATKNYVDGKGSSPNALINGGFRYWERGPIHTFSGVSVNGYNVLGYSADRWYAQIRDDFGGGNPYSVDYRRITVNGSGLLTTQRVAQILNQTAGWFGFYQLVQEVDRETIIRLRGKKVSWRVAVRKGATSPANADFFIECFYGTGAVSQKLSAYTGGGGVFSGSAGGGSLTTGTFTYYSGTSGAVVPATATTMAVLVGVYHNGSGPADATDWVQFGEVQLVAADSPPNEFSWAAGDVTEELYLCQRYYEKNWRTDFGMPLSGSGDREIAAIHAESVADGSPWVMRHPRFRVTKRATPTVRIWTTGSVANNWELPSGTGLTGGTATATAVGNAGPNGFELLNNTGGPATPNAGNAVGQWDADAEI